MTSLLTFVDLSLNFFISDILPVHVVEVWCWIQQRSLAYEDWLLLWPLIYQKQDVKLCWTARLWKKPLFSTNSTAKTKFIFDATRHSRKETSKLRSMTFRILYNSMHALVIKTHSLVQHIGTHDPVSECIPCLSASSTETQIRRIPSAFVCSKYMLHLANIFSGSSISKTSVQNILASHFMSVYTLLCITYIYLQ